MVDVGKPSSAATENEKDQSILLYVFLFTLDKNFQNAFI